MQLDRQVHKYEIDPETGTAKLKEVKPIRTFMAKGKPTVHLQAGHFFYDDGSEIPEAEAKALGFDPDFKDGLPTRMKPAPEVEAVLAESEKDALKEWAYEMAGGPHRGRKG